MKIIEVSFHIQWSILQATRMTPTKDYVKSIIHMD